MLTQSSVLYYDYTILASFCRMVYDCYRGQVLVHNLMGWRVKNYSRKGIHQIICTTEQ